ncbi:hypothetical protein SCP_0604360 [Sparassis crispa]|uniref:Transposase domain-containing protein n=1 Tax=Sparassis crispa TaxID=139825 RepID=A0A401GQF6_9APHY|nr:hypothetical protein SCP_0604360 [Sparassis crispa]GBE84457.1 hypothetical protein SCP_0604360 [Sparassis crispa]
MGDVPMEPLGPDIPDDSNPLFDMRTPSPVTFAASVDPDAVGISPALHSHTPVHMSRSPSPLLQERELGYYEDPDDEEVQRVLRMSGLDPESVPVMGNADMSTPERQESVTAAGAEIRATCVAQPPEHELDDPDSFIDTRKLPPLGTRLSDERAYLESHPKWFVRAILMVVGILHTKYHVTFRASSLILYAIRAIFIALRLLNKDDSMPATLTTLLKRLDLKDRFHVLPVCKACKSLFEPTINRKSACPKCGEKLFPPSEHAAVRELRRLLGRDPPKPPPILAAPYAPLSAEIADFLSHPGMDKEVVAWETEPSLPGRYSRIMDGDVWKTLPGPDKKPFFSKDESRLPEIRIGVSMSLDWFSCSRTSFAPSHSSGPMAFCVQNLRESVKYRPQNILVCAMTPGPTEPTAEQVQNYLKLVVDDLLNLYENSVIMKTPSHPDGICVRVALVAVVCDHPAMCKVSGFADKNHAEVPCTKCHVKQNQMFSDEGLSNGFPLRNGEDHKRLAREWKMLSSEAERAEFFKAHGVRWTELARLPYFDPVRMTVIDPMHNFLLGVVKNQWYGRWIKYNALRANTPKMKRELAIMHEFLETFESPPWVGRLPLHVGEPAGGSLSADEYKALAITVGPLILPVIWEEFCPEAKEDHQKALKKWRKAKKK